MEQQERTRSGRVRRAAAAIGIASGLGLAAGGLGLDLSGVAGAAAPADGAPAERAAPVGGAHRMRGPGAHLGRAIHGEMVVPGAAEGEYRTMATQVGTVVSAGADAVRVRSEDGFERTYLIDDATVVTSGRNGVDDVVEGDSVRVLAVKEGDEYRAIDVRDVSHVRANHERWRVRPRMVPTAPDADGAVFQP